MQKNFPQAKKFLHTGDVFANMYGIKAHLCVVQLHGYVRGPKHHLILFLVVGITCDHSG